MKLQSFFNKYGKNTTTNFELEHYAKELNIPNFYCLMRDELCELRSLETTKGGHLNDINLENFPLNIIINLHTSEQQGVHWSCIFVKDLNNAYFFDSYGLDPTKEIIEFLKPIKNRMCSTFKLQNENDKYCGILSLYVLYCLSEQSSSEQSSSEGSSSFNFYNLIFSIKKDLKNNNE